MRPVRCSRWPTLPGSCMRPAACSMSTPSRRSGKFRSRWATLGADLVTLSAHKIGGPKGVGALVLTEGLEGLGALLRGGGQEQGRRAGTENVAGIIGFGAATRIAMVGLDDDANRLQRLRNQLERGLRQAPEIIMFSEDAPRLPNTVLFTAPGLKAETAVIGLRPCWNRGYPQVRPAPRARSSPPTSWRRWVSVRISPKEPCGSVWAGPHPRRTSIAVLRLGESSPVPYLERDETRLERF